MINVGIIGYGKMGQIRHKEISKLARQHNDANIISLPARFLSINECIELVEIFINEPFEGGRHEKRVKKI